MTNSEIIRRDLDQCTRQLQATRDGAVRSSLKRRIKALEEAHRDILNTEVTLFKTASSFVDKNNFASYEKQVQAAWDMYEGIADYGGEMLAGIVDIRSAFIAGEGLSFTCKKKAAADFIKEFIEYNCLNAGVLMEIVATGELEGKVALTLSDSVYNSGLAKDKGKKYVVVDALRWIKQRYFIERNAKNRRQADKLTYKEKDKDMSFGKERLVYIELGMGGNEKPDETPARIHRVLTQIDNFSRAGYDLRNNTHLFGRVMPYWKTATAADAISINNNLEKSQWKIGDGYVGPAEFGLREPTGAAGAAIEKDALMALKVVSAATGVPVHWLAWPELMSNRATAENLMEIVVAQTKKERLIYEYKLKELILKAMVYAVDNLGYPANILTDDFTVRLPFVSIALLKAIIEVYDPLRQEGIISKHTETALLPGSIDYDNEQELIEEERKEDAEHSDLNTDTVDAAVKELQKPEEGGEEEPGAKGEGYVE